MGNESLDTRNRKQPSRKGLSHNGCNASDEGPRGAQWTSVNFLKFCECVCECVGEGECGFFGGRSSLPPLAGKQMSVTSRSKENTDLTVS